MKIINSMMNFISWFFGGGGGSNYFRSFPISFPLPASKYKKILLSTRCFLDNKRRIIKDTNNHKTRQLKEGKKKCWWWGVHMCKFDFIFIPNWKWWIAFFYFFFLTNKRILFQETKCPFATGSPKKKGDGLFKKIIKLGDYVPLKKKSKIKVGSTETCVIFPVVFSPDIILLTTPPPHRHTETHTPDKQRAL